MGLGMSRLNIASSINGFKLALDALSEVNSIFCILQEYRRKQIFRTHSTRDWKVDPFTKTNAMLECFHRRIASCPCQVDQID
jgi:hypothetical protein